MKATRQRSTAIARFRSSEFKLAAAAAGSTERPFEGIAYNGGIMAPTLIYENRRVDGPVVVDLDTLKFHNQQRPVLDDHDDTTDGLIGRTTSIEIRNYTMPISGVLYTQKTRTRDLLAANRGGHEWQLSVGLDSFTLERVPAGKSVMVNARRFIGPLNVLRHAYMTDVSFVAVGGDDTTWAKIAAKRARSRARLDASASSKGSAMTFEEWLKANYPELDFGTLSEADQKQYRDEFAAVDQDDEGDDNADDEGDADELTKEEKQAALAAARRRKQKAKKEAARAKASRSTNRNKRRPIGTDGASIDEVIDRALARRDRFDRLEAARVSKIEALANGNDALAQRAIKEGWSSDKFELALLRAGRSSHSGATSQSADDEAQVMEAALLINSSHFRQDRLKEFYTEQVLNRAMAGRYRGFSMVECGDRLIRRAGMNYDGSRNQKGHMEAVRDASNRLRASGFTGLNLANILENVADKVLIDAYQAVETKWQEFCAIRSLSDFKIHSQYALDPTNVFKKVGVQGDFAQMQFSDRKYSLQAESFGLRLKVDYQTWRNDDMGAINDRVSAVGQLGASTIDMVAHVLLMLGINNASLFHANNKNYDATAACAFGIAGLTFAEKMWANQVRPNGTPLGVSPQTLLVGTALTTAAGQVYKSDRLNEAGTTDRTKGAANPFVSKYSPVTDPYLNNTLLKDLTGDVPAALSHQDDGLWMLLARQGNNAPLHVGFLDGQQSPKVEVINNQSELVGFELMAALHFGVGYGDPKLASAFNPNAA